MLCWDAVWTKRAPLLATSRCETDGVGPPVPRGVTRSEEHTSELQSRLHLVCRLLLEQKNTTHVPRRAKPPSGRPVPGGQPLRTTTTPHQLATASVRHPTRTDTNAACARPQGPPAQQR